MNDWQFQIFISVFIAAATLIFFVLFDIHVSLRLLAGG